MTLNKRLMMYIRSEILPQYSKCDQAHGEQHIEYVMDRSLKLAHHYKADCNLSYTIAAYHDIGMLVSREKHEIISGEILEQDSFIKNIFNKEQLGLMKEAIAEHRASYKGMPRTIYGKIISQADRNFDIEMIMFRAVSYGKMKYPEYTKQQHFERIYEYLQSKYSSSGYLRLWLEFEDDQIALDTLQTVLSRIEELEIVFGKYY